MVHFQEERLMNWEGEVGDREKFLEKDTEKSDLKEKGVREQEKN